MHPCGALIEQAPAEPEPGAALRDLEVLVLDCQASGATPEHGDLLELAWGFVGPSGLREVEAHWIRPRTARPISQPVRRLLGWSEECLHSAIDADAAWARLRARVRARTPTVIHWARFEARFLAALAGGPSPFDIRCLHAIAERLFPGLPKKNLRALAGHLGHSASLLRQARGHVEATAYVWRALVPRLEREGVVRWADLDTFLARPAPQGTARDFPYTAEKRRALPARPGVYRFLRPNGDVLYVGKASNLRARVTSHFTGGRGKAGKGGKSDALEMLSQAADVAHTVTETAVEAALLEVDEIHRLDPPYNSQLRAEGRRAWFASRDFADVRDAPDRDHPIGPLPSPGSVAGLAAMTRLLAGDEPTLALRAAAVRAPEPFAPDRAIFDEAWSTFAPKVPLLDAGRALHPFREETPSDESAPVWTSERVGR
ncbi:MAG: GIY-YIG nuclease family protein, partial [Myxococcales bacterium]|nr:GIY-YIG nuclease family protein [Myxococcales bacterium]